MARPTTSSNGTLIIRDGDTTIQYSLEEIEADIETAFDGAGRIDLWAQVAGKHFVDLDGNSDKLLALLLELYGEQARLGASDEALATTRHRIREHIKKEPA